MVHEGSQTEADVVTNGYSWFVFWHLKLKAHKFNKSCHMTA